MLYKVTWDMNIVKGVNKTMPEEEVLPFVKSLADLGFTSEVTIATEPGRYGN